MTVLAKAATWAVASAVAALSASYAASSIFERRGAAQVAALPDNGRAEGNLAVHMLAAQTAENGNRLPEFVPPEISARARHAFALDPTSVESVRLLALDRAGRGDEAAARRLMEAALAVSNRDVGANIWLSQDAAESNDVARAFRYYDRALRVSPSVAATVLPAMAGLLKNPRMVAPLALMLKGAPPWAPDLWEQIVRTPGIAANAARLRLELSDEAISRNFEIDRQLLAQLVEAAEFDLAKDLYRAVAGKPPAVSSGSLGSGNAPPLPPLDWETFSEGGFSALIDRDTMLVSVMSGSHGTIARKLLGLGPGSYRLIGTVAGMPASAKLSASLRCAQGGRARSRLTVEFVEGSASGEIDVPSGCRQQWLELVADGPTNGAAAADFTLEQLRLEPL